MGIKKKNKERGRAVNQLIDIKKITAEVPSARNMGLQTEDPKSFPLK